MIRVLVVDDHASSRVPLAALLSLEADFHVVGQAGSLAEARDHQPKADIILLDLGLPDGSGIDLIEEIRDAGTNRIVVVLTGESDLTSWAEAIEAGAAAVLHKAAAIDEVIAALRAAAAGESVHRPEETLQLLRLAARRRTEDRKVQSVIASLTAREQDVLQALAQGLTDKDIAQLLSVSPKTIRVHMANILGKLGVSSRLQALIFAVRHSLVSLD